MVTIIIDNIFLNVAGRIPINGVYPSINTTGEFSIRGLPFNALHDAAGSCIMFYNNNGQVNAGVPYIIAGTNSIRFSSTGFADSFGIRGVTITYLR
jgi:hypothetical protein